MVENFIFDQLDVKVLLFLLAAGFVASFIDSVVGGGGLIMLPSFLLFLDPVTALGTNKLAAVMGAFTSALSFLRSGKGDRVLLRYLFPLSFFGSILGVYTVRLISPDILRPLVVVMLILVALYSVLKKDWGANAAYAGLSVKKAALSAAAAALFGFYDGFFGPGTGSFLIFFFLCIGFDFLGAAANARVLNFASNIAAASSFIFLGLTDYHYGIPTGGAMILGALAGTRLALRKGAGYVRPLFILVTAVLIGKQIWDLWSP
jgi:uncharacterized membrane protein YfcA